MTSRRTPARALIESLESRRLFNAGDLDTTFSGDGRTSVPGFNPNDIVSQPDGKIVASGYYSGTPAVVRMNENGTLDTGFGSNGVCLISQFFYARAVALQSTGKIVVLGTVYDGDEMSTAVARVTTTGQLDSTFSGGGVSTWDVGGFFSFDQQPQEMLVQNDDKIVMVGSIYYGVVFPDDDAYVLRFNANGSIDSGFGEDGELVVDFGDDEYFKAVAIDYNGSPQSNPLWGTLAVVGELDVGGEARIRALVCRVTPDGDLDSGFDENGALTTDFPGRYASATGVLIQPFGRIVIGGTRGDFGQTDNNFIVARYLSNGALDTAGFGAGLGYAEAGFGSEDDAHGMVQSYLGGLLLAGVSSGQFVAAAFDFDGVPDTRFDDDGKAVLGSAGVDDVSLATNGIRKFVVASYASAIHRAIDVGSIISIEPIDNETAEAGGNPASFKVRRTEASSHLDRVFFNVTGTARRPGIVTPIGITDYNGTNIKFDDQTTGNVPYVELHGAQSEVTVTITALNDTLAEGDETAIFTLAPNPTFDIIAPTSMTIAVRDNDITGGPTVTSSNLNVATAPQSLSFRFNQLVSSSFTLADITVLRLPSGVPITASGITHNNATNTATISFSGILPDSRFRATLTAAGITGPTGLPMPANHVFEFSFLNGDANSDGAVDVFDLGVLATNWQQSGRVFTEGDFNYDGSVNVADLGILATNWQKTTAAFPGPDLASARAADGKRTAAPRMAEQVLWT